MNQSLSAVITEERDCQDRQASPPLAVISSPHFPFVDLLVVQWNSQAHIPKRWDAQRCEGSISFLTAGGTDHYTLPNLC